MIKGFRLLKLSCAQRVKLNSSERPFKWAQNEGSIWKSYVCEVGWKFDYKKKVTFAEKQFESCAYVFESKNTFKWQLLEYSSGLGSEAFPHILQENNLPY